MLENEGITKSLPALSRHQVFTNVLQDPRQTALPFHLQLPSQLCSLTALALDPLCTGCFHCSQHSSLTACKHQLCSEAFPDQLIKMFILSLTVHISSLLYFSLWCLLPCTNYAFYLFILLTVTPHQKWKLHGGRNVGQSHFYFLWGEPE